MSARAGSARLPPEYDVHVVTAEGTYPMSDGRPILVDDPGRNVVLRAGNEPARDLGHPLD